MKADVLACYDDTWIDWIIRKVTKEKVTHIAIQVMDDYIIETGWHGVKLSKLSSRKGKFYRLRCNELNEYKQEQIVRYALSLIDQPYDYRQLIWIGLYKLFGFKKYKDDTGKYICVEVVVDAYKSAGIDLVPNGIPLDLVIPSDLLHCDKLTIVT